MITHGYDEVVYDIYGDDTCGSDTGGETTMAADDNCGGEYHLFGKAMTPVGGDRW